MAQVMCARPRRLCALDRAGYVRNGALYVRPYSRSWVTSAGATGTFCVLIDPSEDVVHARHVDKVLPPALSGSAVYVRTFDRARPLGPPAFIAAHAATKSTNFGRRPT